MDEILDKRIYIDAAENVLVPHLYSFVAYEKTFRNGQPVESIPASILAYTISKDEKGLVKLSGHSVSGGYEKIFEWRDDFHEQDSNRMLYDWIQDRAETSSKKDGFPVAFSENFRVAEDALNAREWKPLH